MYQPAQPMRLLDTVQTGTLLTLTGGTTNPFAPLMLVPVTIGAAALRMRDTVPLAALTVALVTLMALAGVPLPARLAAMLVSRVKVMARLDIAERRVPQDGRVTLRIGGHDVDARQLKEALLARIENLDEEGSWVESAGAPYDTYLEPEDAP